ncbi:MAG TPA: MBL fold metallo-hydrolase [Acidimicrobiales bacterium]|nr:MBL fold metallo-hydrolase [Acidimicrobiales bacterium]
MEAARGTASDVAAATLTVLGCDGTYPGPGGAASGYLIEAGGVVVWLEAGHGTFANLQLLTDPARVDAVVLSHEHPDHWSDVDALAAWCRLRAPVRPVGVYAPPGLRARAHSCDADVLAWHEVEPSYRVPIAPRDGAGGASGVADAGAAAGVICSFAATDHGPPTLAVRVDVTGGTGGSPPLRSLGYSADTGPDWSPDELGPGLGLLLCEATYTRDHEGEARHLSGRQAGAMAASAGIGRLVLTHRRPSVAEGALAVEADEAFGRPVHQAAPGRVFEW